MAAFVNTRSLRRYIDREKRDDIKRLKDALYEGGNVAMQSIGQIYQLPDFVFEGTTDTNTAAASSPVINLTDEGVSFPANTHRDIMVTTWAANGSNTYRFTTRQRVLGGTDPTVKGPEEFITECEAYYGFTSADGTTTTEDATACIGPAWWDGASPAAGNLAGNAFTIQWLGTNAPVRVLVPKGVQTHDGAAVTGDSRVFQHGNVNLTNGTSEVFCSDVATPAAANFTANSVVRANAYLLPPVWTPVLIDTTPTPDKVFIGAQGLSGDLVTWVIRVWISDPITLPLL